jgi:antitoxin ParD1/3/4
MSTINISLPDSLKTFIDEQVAAQGYNSAEEYLRDLVRKQRDIEQLRQTLLEGTNSPVVGAMDNAWFDSLRKRAQARAAE